MSYVDDIRKKFDSISSPGPDLGELTDKLKDKLDIPSELARLYAFLALTSGAGTTNEEVHDAWAYWTAVDRDDPDHKSMVPFDDLDEDVQDLDTPYRDAIREVARERSAHVGRGFYDPMDPVNLPRIASDFRDLFPKLAAEPDDGPIYYLWVYDPHEDKVHVEHNEDRHPADHVDHSHLGERVPHPDRVHGFAYRIRGGWRITTDDHRTVDDPHVLEAVRLKLKGEHRQAPSIAPRHKT